MLPGAWVTLHFMFHVRCIKKKYPLPSKDVKPKMLNLKVGMKYHVIYKISSSLKFFKDVYQCSKIQLAWLSHNFPAWSNRIHFPRLLLHWKICYSHYDDLNKKAGSNFLWNQIFGPYFFCTKIVFFKEILFAKRI